MSQILANGDGAVRPGMVFEGEESASFMAVSGKRGRLVCFHSFNQGPGVEGKEYRLAYRSGDTQEAFWLRVVSDSLLLEPKFPIPRKHLVPWDFPTIYVSIETLVLLLFRVHYNPVSIRPMSNFSLGFPFMIAQRCRATSYATHVT